MKLRLCHVLSSLQVGGAEKIALRLAEAQRRAGHAVSVLAFQDGPLRGEVSRLGLPLHVPPQPRLWARTVDALAFCARRRFHVVNTHNTAAHRPASFARLIGAKVVMTKHGEARQPLGMWSTPAFCDGIITVSARVAEVFREIHPGVPTGPLAVILNGVAARPASGARAAIRAALGLGPGPVLVTVARLDPLKDHPALLEAFAAIRARFSTATLLLIGDGERRSALEASAAALGLGPAVRFLGYRDDVPDLLAAADLFVLPSLSEGLPIAALEAMAAGRAVVASRVGGTPEVIADGETGLLVPPRDAPALGAAITRLLANDGERAAMGAAGRRRAEEEFSLEGMAARYEAFYRSLL